MFPVSRARARCSVLSDPLFADPHLSRHGDAAGLGQSKQRYARPASSLLLFAVPMACAMLTMFVEYSLVTIAVDLLFHADLPLLGPGLLAVVLIALFQAILWSTSNSLGVRWLTFLAAAIALVYGTLYWAPLDAPLWGGALYRVGGPQALAFVLAASVSCAAGTAGFAWLRHGSGFNLRRIADTLSRSFRDGAIAPHYSLFVAVGCPMLAGMGRAWLRSASGHIVDRHRRAAVWVSDSGEGKFPECGRPRRLGYRPFPFRLCW